jgi:hypothetical protein
MWILKKNNPLKASLKKLLPILLLLHLSAICSYAQKKSAARSSGGSFPYQWGIGLKLGDPTGLTVKKYMENRALELIVGYPYYYNSYYGNRFKHDKRYKNYGFGNPYKYSNRASIQVRYLMHKDLSDFRGLRWYAGIGGQLRTISYYYDYTDQYGNPYTGKSASANLGIDGVVGMEYTFEDLPLSVFADINLYIELIRLPFYMEGQGGIGIRYNLK